MPCNRVTGIGPVWPRKPPKSKRPRHRPTWVLVVAAALLALTGVAYYCLPDAQPSQTISWLDAADESPDLQAAPSPAFCARARHGWHP